MNQPFPFQAFGKDGDPIIVVGFSDGLLLVVAADPEGSHHLTTLLPEDVSIEPYALPYNWPNPWSGS